MKKSRFYLCSMIVVGTQYHGSPQTLGKIVEDDKIDLKRELDNIYDPNAIAVLWEGCKIGYVPREYAALLSALMDNGCQIQAAVDEASQGIVSMNLWMFR